MTLSTVLLSALPRESGLCPFTGDPLSVWEEGGGFVLPQSPVEGQPSQLNGWQEKHPQRQHKFIQGAGRPGSAPPTTAECPWASYLASSN